jgi:hypothetical protein
MDDEIRDAYHLYVEYNSRKAIGSCARKLGLPKWMVTRRGGTLGLARVKEPAWSADEVALLERWGHLKALDFTTRIQNVFNEQYQEVRGFPALGINALVGLRATLQ